MEKIGQNMPHMNRVRQFDYQELVKQIMANPDVAAFIGNIRIAFILHQDWLITLGNIGLIPQHHGEPRCCSLYPAGKADPS